MEIKSLKFFGAKLIDGDLQAASETRIVLETVDRTIRRDARRFKGRVFLRLAFIVLALIVSPLGAAQAAETVTYYYTSPQGTVLATADSAGNILTSADYRPYGGQALGTPEDGPGYTGHVNDADSGLVYMQARYYDPETGRFLSVDSAVSGAGDLLSFGRFTYASNNPIRFIDPDGKRTVAVGVGTSASWLAGGGAQAGVTFSYKSINPATWRIGGYASASGQAGSQLGVGVGAVFSTSTADSAEEMAADGGDASAGGSVNLGVAVGYERSMCTECQPITSLSFGAKLSPLPFEVHASVGVSGGTTWIGTTPRAPTVTVGPLIPVPPPPPPPPKDEKLTSE